MVNKHPRRFDTEVLRDTPPHGYIIVFGGSHNTNVLENATLSVLSGEGPREGRSSNPLRHLFLSILSSKQDNYTHLEGQGRVLVS